MPDQGLIQENVPLSPLTTLRIGGPARFFAEAREEDELLAAFSFAERRGLPALRPLLEGLAKSTTALRAADWNVDLSGELPDTPTPEHAR